MLYLVTLAQLAAVLLWLPPLRETLDQLTGFTVAPYAAIPFALATLGWGVVFRIRPDGDGRRLARVHGAGLGLFGSAAVLMIADATGVDLGDWDTGAFDGGPAGTAIYWRLMATVFAPVMFGIFFDRPVCALFERVLHPLRMFERVPQALTLAALGFLLGSGIAFFFWSDSTAATVTELDSLYWEALGTTGGTLVPVGILVALQVLPKRRD